MSKKERKAVSTNLDTVHSVKDSKDRCQECDDWGKQCEICGVSSLFEGKYEEEKGDN